MDQQKTGRFLKKLRTEKGLTQEQLAEILHVSNRSVSRWENGVNMPDLDLLVEIAHFYDVEIDELLDGERKEENMDKKTEELVLKVADYDNDETLRFQKKMRCVLWAGLAAFLTYMILDILKLTDTAPCNNIADFMLGIVLGALLTGTLYTSRHMSKIRAFKRRLLHRSR